MTSPLIINVTAGKDLDVALASALGCNSALFDGSRTQPDNVAINHFRRLGGQLMSVLASGVLMIRTVHPDMETPQPLESLRMRPHATATSA